MKKNFIKIACGIAAATLTFTLMACDDSNSASANGPDNEEISSESNGGDGLDSSESTNLESSAESSAEGEGSSTSTDESSASLDDNSSSSMAVTCLALTLECYSAEQLCHKGETQYCAGSSSSNNSSSSAEKTCKNVSNIDGGTCQDGDVIKDCATGAYAVCRNNGWTLAIIGDNCRPIGYEISVNEIKLTCNEDSYWEYEPVYNNCPTGNYSCQPPNYGCLTHPINGFSCDERNEKVYELIVYTRGAGDCLYQCSGGKYSVVMPPAPVGN